MSENPKLRITKQVHLFVVSPFISYGENLKAEISYSNTLIIHQVSAKKIVTVTVFGYLILICFDFYDFVPTFPP